jgi:Na+/H+ antiporter
LHEVEVILGLLVAVAVLVTIARKLSVPYPVPLVIGGLALALIPGLPTVELKPELTFLLFLPPLLYRESLTSPLRDFRSNARPILSLAIGLVIATTCAVAWVAHTLMPGMSWPAAFVLGAVVAPTDEVAVAEVANKLSIPHRVIAILEGESLVNDAISLVIYRMAIAALITGTFSIWTASLRFFLAAAGGVAIGLAVGWGSVQVRKLLDDPPVENTISLVTPFAAWIPAEALGVSGVLAVVTVGLYMGQVGPRLISSKTRLQAQGMWGMIAFLLNGLLFILSGMQLKLILRTVNSRTVLHVLEHAGWIVLALLVVRALWVVFNIYGRRLIIKRSRMKAAPPWQETFLISWTGVRGGISLVTALAVPLTLANGARVPYRDEMISITFCVLLVTLLLQGLTLPWVIGRLKFKPDGRLDNEETRARLAATKAALSHLERVAEGDGVEVKRQKSPATARDAHPEVIEDLREHYREKAHRLSARVDGGKDGEHEARAGDYTRLKQEMIKAERETIIRMRDEGEINDEVLQRIQQDLDLEELRLAQPEEEETLSNS